MAAKPAAGRASGGKRRKAQPADPEGAIIDAAFRLAAVQGWQDTSLADIAAEAGLPLETVRHHFGSKLAILIAFTRRIDEQVLAGTEADIAEEPVRDRLFDVLMRRFDALRPYRDGLAAVGRDLRRDPPALACVMTGAFPRSMSWMLEAARVPSWGPLQPLQLKGLSLLYLSVLRVWFRDEGEDQGHTMAALDKALNRADSVVAMLRRGPRRRRGGEADDGVEAAEAPES